MLKVFAEKLNKIHFRFRAQKLLKYFFILKLPTIFLRPLIQQEIASEVTFQSFKMSNLNEYTLARNIWRYAGKKLEYIDLTGKKGSGTLVGMQVHEETRETIALFRVSFLSMNFCH